MSTCRVFGNKPGDGPGMLAAEAAREQVNKDHPTWKVTTKSWTTTETVYESNVATGDQLEKAFKKEFPTFNVVGTD